MSVWAIWPTARTSPSSDHVDDIVLHPALAAIVSPSNVTLSSVPGTRVKPWTSVPTNVLPPSESASEVADVVVVAATVVVVAAAVVVAAMVVVTSLTSALSSPHATRATRATAPTTSFIAATLRDQVSPVGDSAGLDLDLDVDAGGELDPLER